MDSSTIGLILCCDISLELVDKYANCYQSCIYLSKKNEYRSQNVDHCNDTQTGNMILSIALKVAALLTIDIS